VRPNTLGRVDVGAGHIDRHRASRRIHTVGRLHELFGQSLADQVVALLDELRRHESPLVAAAHEKRVLGRCLDPPVDDHEPVVLAEFDAPHAGHRRLRAAHPPVREPLVLGLVGHIGFQAGDLDRGNLVTGLEVLDGREAAVAQADERAEEQAVGATSSTAAPSATTTASSARAATAAAARATTSRSTATGPASPRRTATTARRTPAPTRRTPATGRTASA
jgi:hypothetical protein